MRSLRSILVTGGAGFIGSTLVRQLLNRPDVEKITVLDALTNTGNSNNLKGPDQDPRFTFIEGDIRDQKRVSQSLIEHQCTAIMNLAAESHVDQSIEKPHDFIDTNVGGMMSILSAARPLNIPVLQCSTGKVYGSVNFPRRLDESARLRPSSPYSASKAGADLLIHAAHVTYGQDVVIARCTNIYGPRQHRDKLIPTLIFHALRDQPLPIYGSGQQIRDWIHVEDCAQGLIAALERGRPNRVYHLGSKTEHTNIGIARHILKHLHKPESLISHIEDRPGHDSRHALDPTLALNELRWRARIPFRSGFDHVVRELAAHLRPTEPA